MEIILKASALALVSAVLGLLLRKNNAEIGVSLSLCVITVILIITVGLADRVKELAEAVKVIAGPSNALISPVLKCLGIAVVTRITAELCRDSAQAATAAAVEFAGTLCALGVAAPLMLNMLKIVSGFV